MRLLSFRIENFRSIIDSDWNNLSADNITGIIGQNESGKTSILEALSSFYTGTLSEDVLRGDMSLPVVSCCFEVDPSMVEGAIDEKDIPPGIIRDIRSTKKMCLTRIWDEDMGSRIELSGKKVTASFDKVKNEREVRTSRMEEEIEQCLEKKDRSIEKLLKAEKEKKALDTDISRFKLLIAEEQKELKAIKGQHGEKTIIIRLRKHKDDLDKTTADYAEKKKEVAHLKKDAEIKNKKYRLAENSRQSKLNFEAAKEKLDSVYSELRNLQRIINTMKNEIDRRGVKAELDKLNEKYVRSLKEYDLCREDFLIKLSIAYNVAKGMNPSAAERQVNNDKPHINPYYRREEAGSILFEYIPEFVLFEDFSSLLPNRIDLEDILSGNKNVEGMRAARNFLIVSGLDSRFFLEDNSRLLKQKIEKLNKNISVDFQDFWRQRIGKRNKITINFELEHYSAEYAENSGNPYLEFWIKDKHERLYPKQRSRGVRWFLSFYLELKAAAMGNIDKGLILLIDEPGLSLHARAQEDVLKVFDHIKDRIQVMYSTHSPHLIDSKKIYRLLAVQREIEDNDASETKIFNAKTLTAASADTLSPIYTLIGARLSEQQYIRQKNNVILEDISTYYYLSTMLALINVEKDIYLLPASSISNVETLVNLLLGWGLDFVVLTGGNEKGSDIYNALGQNLCRGDKNLMRKYLVSMENFLMVEDLFSTLDFKKHILHQRVGIPESNSVFLMENKYSRAVLATSFMNDVADRNLKFSDFDDETRENFTWLFNKLEKVLY